MILIQCVVIEKMKTVLLTFLGRADYCLLLTLIELRFYKNSILGKEFQNVHSDTEESLSAFVEAVREDINDSSVFEGSTDMLKPFTMNLRT